MLERGTRIRGQDGRMMTIFQGVAFVPPMYFVEFDDDKGNDHLIDLDIPEPDKGFSLPFGFDLCGMELFNTIRSRLNVEPDFLDFIEDGDDSSPEKLALVFEKMMSKLNDDPKIKGLLSSLPRNNPLDSKK